jgi:hypothetical protein
MPSRSRSLPGWAALGPRPSWPPSSFGPSGPVHSHVRLRNDHAEWSAPGHLAAPRCRAATSHFSRLPYPSAVASDRAPLAAVRPAWSAGCSLPPKHTRPGPRGAAPRRPAHDLRSGAHIHGSSGRRPSRRDGAGPHQTRLDPVVTVARRTGCLHRYYRRRRDETAATGRTDRHPTAGRRTGWTPAGRTAASGRGSQMTGHWTGWTADGGTPGPRTADRVG